MIVDGQEGISSLLTNMNRFSEGLVPAGSWNDINNQAPHVIQFHVAAMAELLVGQDVFDVLELVRQHEIPPFLTGYKESQNSGLAAVIDVVALVAIGLGSRVVPADGLDADEEQGLPHPNAIIEDLCAHAREILKLTTLLGLSLGANPDLGPLAELAGQLRSSELMIRGKHYESIGEILNRGILEIPQIEETLERIVGFTYGEISAVRDTIREQYTSKKSALLDAIDHAASLHAGGTKLDASDEALARQAFNDFFISPGAPSAFSAATIASSSGVEIQRVEAVLQTFSHPISGGGAEALITSYANGSNILSGIDLLADGNGNYLMLQNGIPIDHIRRLIEKQIKASPDNNAWNIYGEQRDSFAEKFACELVAGLLGVAAPTYKGLKYLAPPRGSSDCDLSRSAVNPKVYAGDGETDGLFVVDDVAICIEVKAGSIREKARGGNALRLADDLKKTIGEATQQAQRVESLILENGGLWRKNGQWIDLSVVREVHSIAVCLDDFGPLAIAADALVRADLLPGNSIPWIVSLHDLAVAAKLFDSSASFLLYLRRRTEPQAARLFVAVDELDVLMWFLKGGLYFTADPDLLHQRFPESSPPRTGERRRFKKEVPTRVGTLTDDLDAWMYFTEGSSAIEASRPTRSEEPGIERILRYLEANRKPGWLRFGADLANYSSDAQRRLARSIQKVVDNTREDNGFHTLAQGFLTPWGQGMFFVGSQPEGYPDAKRRLSEYMKAKKHQLRADRVLGVLVDVGGSIVETDYQNDPWKPDEELDKLVADMRLVPAERMSQPTGRPRPWRANGRTNRRNGKGKRNK
ncbi:hypothetical protein Pen02_41520 [Plantactinospora endophytica]|uniref:Preprotein translocase subunit SecA n=2 Tax=Plantactinospora endophytica TaxID=673535 RepID=A0ABQ4E3E7_9ACTN|nr:hypothetical protein [Plantactinospora endophytica]GIG89216.1 hypothetical protein Pen02_41520 [Plantactinospora endophytica]